MVYVNSEATAGERIHLIHTRHERKVTMLSLVFTTRPALFESTFCPLLTSGLELLALASSRDVDFQDGSHGDGHRVLIDGVYNIYA